MKAERGLVCATDFSPNAQHAGEVAAAIAARLHVSLALVHVADQPHAQREGTKGFRAALRTARRALRAEARRLRDYGAEVEDVLLHGHWAEIAIAEFVARRAPLLVVVSSVSKTAFDRWTLGSVSEHLAQHAARPTLVVRAPGRLLAWARQDVALNVLVGADFTASASAALAWVGELQKVGRCAVTVAHFSAPAEPAGGAGNIAATLLAGPSAGHRRTRRIRLEGLAGPTVKLQVEPKWGRADAALVRLAGQNAADLVVVGTHQRTGVERFGHASVSRGVLRHATTNVLCVPLTAGVAHGMAHHPGIHRVLVATDLSAAGDQAIPWAYAMVRPAGIVHVVHVTEPWTAPAAPVPTAGLQAFTRRQHRQLVNAAREKLVALVPPEVSLGAVRTEIEVVSDREPARAIGEAATRFGADLICLAARRRSPAAQALFGSVVQGVIRGNTQPVLLVQPQAP